MGPDLRIKAGMARRRQVVFERSYLLLQQRQCLQAGAVVEPLALHQAQEIRYYKALADIVIERHLIETCSLPAREHHWIL